LKGKLESFGVRSNTVRLQFVDIAQQFLLIQMAHCFVIITNENKDCRKQSFNIRLHK